ncbi:MAG: hypothetical protein IKD27_05485 [Oscillospiraceae bacterium]|nr:hypothetical protein [Oscillospiraceae bacterium]
MSKNIGTFLMIMLVICSVLLLMATSGREVEPQTETAASTAPTETAAPTEIAVPTEPTPETEPTEEKTEPTETVTEPSVPAETEPQPATPAVEDADFAAISEENLQYVRRILEREKLAQTAKSHWVWNAGLNAQEGTTGTARSSYGWALALTAAERKMNPIAAFWALNSEGLYSKTEDTSGVLSAASFAVPAQEVREYAYTEDGARQLITDLLVLASGLEDGLAMESGMLGANNAVDAGQVALARKEGCYYGYFISGGERSTHILCIYLRSDREGKLIADVEFQLLNLRAARGSEDALKVLDRRGDTQAATLAAAAELLMTGQTQAGQGLIPFNRQVTSYDASIELFCFTAEGETGTLTNYRLRKA